MTSFLGSKEVAAGALTIGIGAGVVLTNLDHGFGTPRRMGPGFFPIIIGGLMCFVGVLILLGAVREREALPSIPWRPFLVLPLAIVVFALILPVAGLGPAGIATVLIAGLAQGGRPTRGLVILALLLVPAAYLLFAELLGVLVPFLEWTP